MGEWNYDFGAAPKDTYVLASCTNGGLRFIVKGYKAYDDGAFVDSEGELMTNAYAWMPLPDPAPLPEGD